MTSVSAISEWFDSGVSRGYKYMVVFCDTFDYDDYPSYYHDYDSAFASATSPGGMQKYMESYDLSAPKEPQLKALRANCFKN